MSATPDPPGGLQPGEQILRFLLPVPWWSPVRLRPLALGGGLGFLSGAMLFGGLGIVLSMVLSPVLGLVVGLLGMLLGAGIGVTIGLRTALTPWRWWVTTRRLVLARGDAVESIALGRITQLDADPRRLGLQVTVDGEERSLRPVDAMPDLWGALLFARAWQAPAFSLADAPTGPEDCARWADHHDGIALTRGILVFLPDGLCWLPDRVIRDAERIALAAASILAPRIRHLMVDARPPLERLAHLLTHADADDAFLATEAKRAALAWGGWVRGPGPVSARFEGADAAGTAMFEVDDIAGRFTSARFPRDRFEALTGPWEET